MAQTKHKPQNTHDMVFWSYIHILNGCEGSLWFLKRIWLSSVKDFQQRDLQLRWCPIKRTCHRFPRKLGMLSVQCKEMLKRNKKRGWPGMFSCHNAEKYGYFGDFWQSQWARHKLDYFSMQHVLSHRVWLSLIICSSTSRKKYLQMPCTFLSFKRNII